MNEERKSHDRLIHTLRQLILRIRTGLPPLPAPELEAPGASPVERAAHFLLDRAPDGAIRAARGRRGGGAVVADGARAHGRGEGEGVRGGRGRVAGLPHQRLCTR